MAVYKVIQDIEAEDKLLGPLTLKGFIYAIIAGFLAFLNFKILVASQLGYFRLPMIILFGLPMLLFGVLASPLGREQPTEIWLLSRLRYFLMPKRRLWNQSGLKQLVTVTAPKKTEKKLTKDLSQSEVKSRLKTLAMTMDTRGWAVKNSSVNLSHVPGYLEEGEAGDSDRLIGVSKLPQTSLSADVGPDDDIMDEENNPTARHFWDLLRVKDAERKQKMSDRIKEVRQSATETAKPQPAYHIPKDESELNIKFQEAEKAFHAEHRSPTATNSKIASQDNADTTQVNPQQATAQTQQPTQNQQMTAVSQAAKLELAQSGNDLSVASIQKLANRQPRVEQIGPNEVVIKLH